MPEVGRVIRLLSIFDYFRVFWSYFHVNGVGKAFREAIINYVCEKTYKLKTKIDIRPALVGFGYFRFKSQQGQHKGVQVIFLIYLII